STSDITRAGASVRAKLRYEVNTIRLLEEEGPPRSGRPRQLRRLEGGEGSCVHRLPERPHGERARDEQRHPHGDTLQRCRRPGHDGPGVAGHAAAPLSHSGSWSPYTSTCVPL